MACTAPLLNLVFGCGPGTTVHLYSHSRMYDVPSSSFNLAYLTFAYSFLSAYRFENSKPDMYCDVDLQYNYFISPWPRSHGNRTERSHQL